VVSHVEVERREGRYLGPLVRARAWRELNSYDGGVNDYPYGLDGAVEWMSMDFRI
jgi:hypothetical protein